MQEQKGEIVALCISEARGTVKHAVPQVKLIKDYGIEGDDFTLLFLHNSYLTFSYIDFLIY